MTAVTPEVIARDDAVARLGEIRRSVGDAAEFRRRAEAYELDAKESALYDDLMELEYLLGLER